MGGAVLRGNCHSPSLPVEENIVSRISGPPSFIKLPVSNGLSGTSFFTLIFKKTCKSYVRRMKESLICLFPGEPLHTQWEHAYGKLGQAGGHGISVVSLYSVYDGWWSWKFGGKTEASVCHQVVEDSMRCSLWCHGHVPSSQTNGICQGKWRLLMKKLINNQSKKEVGNCVWANLRIIIWEIVFQKVLRTVSLIRSQRQLYKFLRQRVIREIVYYWHFTQFQIYVSRGSWITVAGPLQDLKGRFSPQEL